MNSKESPFLPFLWWDFFERKKFFFTDKPIIKCTCHILSDIVRSASIEGTTSRKVMYNSIQGHIDLCSTILTAYVTEAGLCLFSFYHAFIHSFMVEYHPLLFISSFIQGCFFICSLIHPSIHSFIYSFTFTFIHSFIRQAFIRSLDHPSLDLNSVSFSF